MEFDTEVLTLTLPPHQTWAGFLHCTHTWCVSSLILPYLPVDLVLSLPKTHDCKRKHENIPSERLALCTGDSVCRMRHYGRSSFFSCSLAGDFFPAVYASGHGAGGLQTYSRRARYLPSLGPEVKWVWLVSYSFNLFFGKSVWCVIVGPFWS